ncbi:MAG TPA: hypothetical protein VMV48_02620 [Gallionellaceae bacterium]|nr:hypothetical protein [Gallionellaceae bacterium]
MSRTEIIDAIKILCEKLNNELPAEEYVNGWTDAMRMNMLRYFQKIEHDLVSGAEIRYIPLGRTLDSVGISEGKLLEEAFRITNKINAHEY